MLKMTSADLFEKYGIHLPKGKYRVYAKSGAYEICSVKDDTEGCILVGMQATERSLIGGTSKPAVRVVKQEILEAIERGEAVTITVRNPA